MAARPGQVIGLVIVQVIGHDQHVAPAQCGVAVDRRVEVRAPRDAVAGDQTGQIFAPVARQRFAKQRRAFEQHRRVQQTFGRLDAMSLQQRQREHGQRLGRTAQARRGASQIRHRQEEGVGCSATTVPALRKRLGGLDGTPASSARKRPAPSGFVESIIHECTFSPYRCRIGRPARHPRCAFSLVDSQRHRLAHSRTRCCFCGVAGAHRPGPTAAAHQRPAGLGRRQFPALFPDRHAGGR